MKEWLKTVGIKALKTMAETAFSVLSTSAVGFANVDWLSLLSMVALSGVVTVLINIKTIDESGSWIRKLIIRVVKTVAETVISMVGTTAVGLLDINWKSILSAVAFTAVITVLFNIKTIGESESEA